MFYANQSEAIINYFNISVNQGLGGTASTDQPSNSTLGPAWFEAFQTSPKGTKFIYDLNYRDNSTAGHLATVDVAKRVYKQLGSSLFAYELGNEMEKWGGRYRPDDWSPPVYAKDYLNWTDQIEQALFGENSHDMPLFQMGALQGSGNITINQPWNSVVIMGDGVNDHQQIKSASQHDVSSSPVVRVRPITDAD